MMKHTYIINGMTCGSCEAKVKSLLLAVDGITEVDPSKEEQAVTIAMDRHVSLKELQTALGGKDAKYQLEALDHPEAMEQVKSSWKTYRPIVLVFAYITGATLLVQLSHDRFHFMEWMRHFMAGFFLVFSFFKLLNLEGFADGYAMYDIVAKRFRPWGYLYAFIELGLGIAFLTDFLPLATNVVTLVVMSVSIIGVLQSVLNKRAIRCACLGAIFELPMSTITIVEDALMIIMSILALTML
jgi:copper chaperone CopZ